MKNENTPNADVSTLTAGDNKFGKVGIFLKIAVILLLLAWTNPDIMDRVHLLLDNSRFATLIPYLAIWGLSVVVFLIAAFQPKPLWRWTWAILLSVSAGVAWGYRAASHNELSAYDILSLWEARHEAARAGQMYASPIMLGFSLFFLSIFIMVAGPVFKGQNTRKWLSRLGWTPILPILMIAGIVYLKSGGGSQALPVQFTSLSLSGLTGVRIALKPPIGRHAVAWKPKPELRQEKIVYLVDEGIRADYVSLLPDNPFTPRFAAAATDMIDFGRAISGGNCSHYSNATLRFMVNPRDIVNSANTNPTIFDYAKKAGYRTVFIDGHTGAVATASEMQSFMTMKEREHIDLFTSMHKLAGEDADDAVLKLIAEELAKPGPVLIYANKNGAHFPYDSSYKSSAAKFHPTVAEAGKDTLKTRGNSYRNSIDWSTDRLMPGFIKAAKDSNALLIYTADHGQNVSPFGLTHCATEKPPTVSAMVPLMLQIPPGQLRDSYVAAAVTLKDKANHYMLAPTVLKWMGYTDADVGTVYKSSLLKADPAFAPAFTTGDIFGLFSNEVNWTPIDVNEVKLEEPADKDWKKFIGATKAAAPAGTTN